jgi:uncharacterized membrane protein YqjE
MAAEDQNELRARPTGHLLRELSDQTTLLVRQEIELAKAELTEKGKTAGVGAGLFGGAGLFAVFALATLTTGVIAALSEVMPLWLAALIVTAVYAAVAAVLGLRGRDKVQEATPLTPQQTTESVKEDVQWAKTRAQSGRT